MLIKWIRCDNDSFALLSARSDLRNHDPASKSLVTLVLSWAEARPFVAGCSGGRTHFKQAALPLEAV